MHQQAQVVQKNIKNMGNNMCINAEVPVSNDGADYYHK